MGHYRNIHDFHFPSWTSINWNHFWNPPYDGHEDVAQLPTSKPSGGANIHQLGGSEASLPLLLAINGDGILCDLMYVYIYIYVYVYEIYDIMTVYKF